MDYGEAKDVLEYAFEIRSNDRQKRLGEDWLKAREYALGVVGRLAKDGRLSERQSMVLKDHLEGKLPKETAESLGLSTARIGQIRSKGKRYIYFYLSKARLEKENVFHIERID